MRKLAKYPTKLFTLMVLCFIGFSSLLLLISGIVYYETYSEIAYREIRTTKKELLDETSRKLSNYVAGIQDTAKFLVTNTMVQQYLSSAPDSEYDFVFKSRQLFEEFRKLATVKEGLFSIELYTDWLIGFPTFQDEFMHPMAEAQAQGWLGRMEKADGYWIESHEYPTSGSAVRMVSYVHRIIGNRGEILGVVKINIPDIKLLEILSKGTVDDRKEEYYVVMDSRGHYIASVLPPGMEAPKQAEDIAREVSGTKFSVIQSDSNSQYWMLQQLISKDVLKQSGKEIRLLIIGLLSALIIVSIPLALWLSRKLTSPIYGIVEGMRTVEKGDFNVRMKASNIQEYLYLTTHFNRMVDRLKALIGRLNQEHRNRREAEIHLLHAQIKPHFLYNTLDLIHWRALDYNAQEISQMVQQLSKLFRIGLSNDNWYVTVRDELAHARCYMAIQEYRQNFSIEYVDSVPSDLLDAFIPKIILQPFLENAVMHGFRNRDDKAVITVSLAHQEEAGDRQLIVTIEDNGSGLPEGFDVQKTGGIGIRNVMDRIHLYCGPKYGVIVVPREHGGTKVIVKLPLIRHEEEMELLTRSFAHEYDSFGG
ncbi:sensor histidine kinase [Cohnella endophytica]|uniref:Sensor histidine kinase n=1 Tax=Cohnella endophytica TaxID=2419778 RepID=A0A494YBH9_9BACL|nr:sensor histidine kinase [Cohnella endophytica]RKP57312.1 sensor histidine kinase [Cohnella endophytica]